MTDDALITRLKVLRAERSLTQADLAAAIGTTRKSINAIEAGRMVPSTLLALKIARALGTSVEDVFSLDPHA